MVRATNLRQIPDGKTRLIHFTSKGYRGVLYLLHLAHMPIRRFPGINVGRFRLNYLFVYGS